MKKSIALFLIVALTITLFTGCGKQLTTTGCEIIHEEDNYVTYQTICDNCGYEFGDPATTYVGRKLFYTVTCTMCREIIYVRIERG